MDSNDVIDTFQFEYIKNNWGSCHIEAFPSIVAKMLNNFIKENRSIFVESINMHDSISGQPTYFCKIYSSKLEGPDKNFNGYHGHCFYFITGSKENDYKIVRDLEV